MKIAIVGSGIAGLGAAYVLSRGHEVEVFEAAPRIGGHVNTIDVGTHPVDTGFIVHTPRTYPLLTRLFAELGVATQESVMSFSVECGCGVAWSSRRPLRAGRLLGEIVRFLRTAGDADAGGRSFDRFVAEEGYSDAFRWHYVVPMTSALWSAAPEDALAFPASYAIDFFANHGMLGLRRHRWRTVVGGSRAYVAALLARLPGPVHAATP
ncbi:MAG: amine oxidase, partial [Actinobacteria bacterium]|nr:amine oxidase [Actinomycetota bacterium]